MLDSLPMESPVSRRRKPVKTGPLRGRAPGAIAQRRAKQAMARAQSENTRKMEVVDEDITFEEEEEKNPNSNSKGSSTGIAKNVIIGFPEFA